MTTFADLLLTGAAGFLGANILHEWLIRNPVKNALCLVRGDSPMNRVLDALKAAHLDAGGHVEIDFEKLLNRITVLRADLCRPDTLRHPEIQWWMKNRNFDVIHCAAHLSLRRS